MGSVSHIYIKNVQIKWKRFKKTIIEVLKITVRDYFRTWEELCLEKLREIGRSSASEWARAMGYGENRNGVTTVIKRIRKTMPEKLRIYYNKRPRLYQALEVSKKGVN